MSCGYIPLLGETGLLFLGFIVGMPFGYGVGLIFLIKKGLLK